MNVRHIISILAITSTCVFSQGLLKVDSVTVDSVWNSDSASRTSRDCMLRFFPAGQGTVRCTVAVSFNAGATWVRVRDSVTIISPSSLVLPCGQKASVRLRFNGADRQNIAFKVTGRQLKPDLSISPAAVFMGTPFSAPASGLDTTVEARLALKNLPTRGYAPNQKVYWDFNGDGVFADSTDSLVTQWSAPASTGTGGQQALLVAKVRDANNLWSTPDTVLVQYGLNRLLTFADLAGGNFSMGNDSGSAAEKPAHPVTVSGFSMLTTEITSECFLLLTGKSPLSNSDSILAPARNMTWFSAILFCNTLSNFMHLDTCYIYSSLLPNGATDASLICDFTKSGYRLPTEAEWEYACRAGSTTTYFWGDSVDTSYAWMQTNSGGVARPVGTRLPNAFGLYDMSGNVSEWVNDVYGPYTAGQQTDPRGETYGVYHTQRGGSAPTSGVLGDNVSSTCRDNGDHTLGYYYNGIRLAKKL